jgi:diguanylate cyclase (GGDEF)-like protein
VGDLLLTEAAARLRTCVREMDTVARIGGDEFVVMLSELTPDQTESMTQATTVAEKVSSALANPYRLLVRREGQADRTVEHRCTASIGIALFVNDEVSQEDILNRADTAMYEAKRQGPNLIRLYDLSPQLSD